MLKMKDSGVDWIGEIPANWSISRIKYVAEFDPVCNKSAINRDSLITYTPMDCIKHGWFINNSAPLESLSTSLTTYQEGDIVMAKVTPCFENGNIAIMEGLYNGFGMGSSELFVFRPKSIDTKFFFYWLQNNAFVQKAKATMTGTGGLKRVSPVFTRNCPIHIPPYKDQNRIALYLDGKLAQVNILIANVQAQIEKLKAYKQSLITEAVTKGLDSTVPMKDSGVEWLGKYPSHWGYMPFGYVLKERNEKNNPVVSEERLSLSIELGVTLYAEKTTNLDRFKDDFSQYKLAHAGDLVMNSMNMIVGATGVSPYFGCVSPAYYTFFDETDDHITAKYCEYVFRSKTMLRVLHSLGKGIYSIERGDDRINTCRLKVPKTDLKTLHIPVPPLDEQRRIVQYMNDKCAQISHLISIKQAKIEKLEQYKRSLIYEYVTGKKEVPAHT
jgi:type I restriction enzyme S subunit